MDQYDIFISYRRSASDFAQLVASHLKSAGYRVFIDVESLRSGKFNTQLFDVIDHCKDFVIILPEDGLSRCSSKDDWVRIEYERAEKAGKNIIPIQLNGFVWPSPMPEGMEELSRYQGLSATSAEYYDLSIKRLRGYLKSRPHRLLKRIISWLAAIVGAILLLFFAAEGILSIASRPVYTRVADNLTIQACVLDLLGDSNAAIDKAWESFVKEYDLPGRTAAKEDLFCTLDQSMGEVLSDLEPLRKQLGTARIELSPWESLLVSIKDISPEEVILSESFVETFFDDIEGRASKVRQVVSNGTVSLIDKNIVNESGQVFHHCSNAFYYGYLSVISLLPEKSCSKYQEMVARWRHFPNGVGLNHPQTEFEQFIQKEFSELERYNYDLSKRTLQIQQKYEEYLLQFDNEISRLVKLYDALLSEARDSLGSDAYLDWERIIMVSSFLPNLVEHEKDPELLPIPIKAAGVAEDLKTLLKDYAAAYPQFEEAAKGASDFYDAVSTSAIPYCGLVITRDMHQERVEAGEIVLSINGFKADEKGMISISDILSKEIMETLEVISLKDGQATPLRKVRLAPYEGQVPVLPLIPFGES